MKRVYHHYLTWEEYHAGMWRKVYGDDKKSYLEKVIEFTGNADLYGEWMLKVITSWPLSCEHNLTAVSTNRKAWIGHAACCLAIGCPEDVTRSAWGYLSHEQRDRANLKADQAIEQWEILHAEKDKGVHSRLETQGVFCWDP